MTVNQDRLHEAWRDRLHAVGRAQARYLWFLVIAGLFYWGLRSGSLQSSPDRGLSLPLVHLELDIGPVREAGAFVISFLAIVVMGAFRAFQTASDTLQIAPIDDARGEATDLDPNFLDLAFYSRPSSCLWIRRLVHFKYPVFISLALAEATFLLVDLWPPWSTRQRGILGVLGLAFWLLAVGQVGRLWYGRFVGAYNMAR
jgi:hypothetical protein